MNVPINSQPNINTVSRPILPPISQFIPRPVNNIPIRVLPPPITTIIETTVMAAPTASPMAAPTASPMAAPIVKSISPQKPIVRQSARIAERKAKNNPANVVEFVSNYIQRKRMAKMKRWKIHNAERLNLALLSYRISVRQALKDKNPVRVSAATKACYDECLNLITNKTFIPVKYVPANHRACILPSFMFLKEKTLADGSPDKWKARLVAGGNFVDTTHAGDISAYVVNPTTVLTMLSVASMCQLNIVTADVTGAFLIPTLSDRLPEVTYVVIDKNTSDIIVKIVPGWEEYRNSDGTFTMLLQKALYGLPISASKWMTHLNNTLTKLQFEVTMSDKCCWTRGTGDSKIILCSHVDDLLVIGKRRCLDIFNSQIIKIYKITIQNGVKHSYIGLDINQCQSTYRISVTQSGYRRDVVNRFQDLIEKCSDTARVPCNEDLVDQKASEFLPEKNQFLSIVMSLMYLSRFTRPDIAFAVSILSTKCAKPTRNDLKQAIKVLKYIAVNPDYAIVYKLTPQRAIEIYADASHGIHPTGHGHGCIIVKIGNGMTFIRSYKLKMITLSSTESEWVVLCDAAQLARWLRELLVEIGISMTEPIIVKQDNTSAIYLSENGPTQARTRHLLIKRNFAREAIIDAIIKCVYCSTSVMHADLGTKILSLRSILKYLEGLGMMIPSTYENIYELTAIKVPAAKISNIREAIQKIQPLSKTANAVSEALPKSRTNLPISNKNIYSAAKQKTQSNQRKGFVKK